jgi:hypothetical protein
VGFEEIHSVPQRSDALGHGARHLIVLICLLKDETETHRVVAALSCTDTAGRVGVGRTRPFIDT